MDDVRILAVGIGQSNFEQCPGGRVTHQDQDLVCTGELSNHVPCGVQYVGVRVSMLAGTRSDLNHYQDALTSCPCQATLTTFSGCCLRRHRCARGDYTHRIGHRSPLGDVGAPLPVTVASAALTNLATPGLPRGPAVRTWPL